MKISDFEFYRDLLQRHAGLSLTPDKTYLFDSRLTPVARKWGYPTIEAMTLALRGVPDTRLINDVIETMMFTDTSFFSEPLTFQALSSTLIPHIVSERRRQKFIRIWSAGCSTGQEAYSVALTLKEMEADLRGWRVEILGTDISAEAIRRAQMGVYSQFEVQRGLPIKTLISHFEERDDSWHINEDIKILTQFETFNILDPMDELGSFDIIFCRNVMTHFDPDLRTSCLTRMADLLLDNGILLLGESDHPPIDSASEVLRPLEGLKAAYGLPGGRYGFESQKKAAG